MIIGTRGSDLARAQADEIALLLRENLGMKIEIMVITTSGDRITDRPLRELEGRGYFTKELEEALIEGHIDAAVHSYKDMPSQCPEPLEVVSVSKREDPADLLIVSRAAFDPEKDKIPIAEFATIGTSAVRREAQLRALRPDFHFKDLRGNVPTRLEKLARGDYAAIILASAGVKRLGLDLSELQIVRMKPEEFVPSPGQGALAIQMRKDDAYIESVRKATNKPEAWAATSLERRVMALFGGGCGLPLGVYACKKDDLWHAYGFWGGDRDNPKWGKVIGENPSDMARQLHKDLAHA